jgi:hypothetical protein
MAQVVRISSMQAGVHRSTSQIMHDGRNGGRKAIAMHSYLASVEKSYQRPSGVATTGGP